MRIFCPAMIFSFCCSHKTFVSRLQGIRALTRHHAHTTVLLSTHFDAPWTLTSTKKPGGRELSMTLCSAACGLGELAKREPMHNLAVSQTRMFSVWNLRYSPTAWHFAQPGRVGTVSLVCLVQSPAAPHGLNITFHRSRAPGLWHNSAPLPWPSCSRNSAFIPEELPARGTR